MNHRSHETIRILAIHPTSGGFGFVIFEWGERLIDWGLKTARHNTNAQCLKLIEELSERYTPDLIVIQDGAEKGSRRCRRVKILLGKITGLAAEKHIEWRVVSRMAVRELFSRSGATTKYQIATAIAARLPELAPWLPRPRKPWMSEDSRMSIFAAAALALTFLSVKRGFPTQRSHNGQN